MRRILWLLVLALTVVASPVLALNLETTATLGNVDSGTVSDADSAGTGSISSEVTRTSAVGSMVGFLGDPTASATASDGGSPDSYRRSSVAVDSLMWDGYPDWINEATASTTLSVTNTTGGDAHYDYDYSLADFIVWISDYSGGATAEVGFEFDILVDGISLYGGSVVLEGGLEPTHSLTTTGDATGLSSTAVSTDDSNYGYRFDGTGPLSADLGTLANGESLLIETYMRTWVHTPGYEIGGKFAGGVLEGTLSYEGISTPPPPPPNVPEPASVVLLGMGGMALLGKRRLFKEK